ncbi:MAG: hypothetical protein QM753_01895 [Thermomicrobiales bacterium]
MPISNSYLRFPRLRAIAAFALCLSMLAGSLLSIAHASANQASPEEMIAALDGLESAYARRYDSHSSSTATPEDLDPAMTHATITILQFTTEDDAKTAWMLTSGTLVAGAIIHESPTDLTARAIPGLGDDAMTYLLPDATGSETEAVGILFVRSGSMGIIVEGEGDTSNAALSERMQAFAQFALDHEPTSPDVTVVAEGMAEGGDFDRMPGPDDADVLRGLVPMWDYDLTVSNSPLPDPDATATPMPSCGCLPPPTQAA